MKNLTKIIALAAIAALAAISCAPEVEISGYDWTINQQLDPTLNTAKYGTDVLPGTNGIQYVDHTKVDSVGIGTVHTDIEISITFGSGSDGQAVDVLRESDIDAGLKKFLSFHQIVRTINPAAIPPIAFSDPPPVGKEDNLSPAIQYSFIRRDDKTVFVKLDITLTVPSANPTPYSQIIAKINGAEFTYAQGLKVDVDGNGIPGEAGYDDSYYSVFDAAASYGQTVITPVFTKAEKDWYFTISSISSISDWSTTTGDISNAYNISAATFNPASLGTSADAMSFRNNIIASFAGAFELQEYDGSSWVFAKTSSLGSSNTIEFNSVQFKHMVPYRIVWKGAADQVYGTSYHGLQQRIDIRGKSNSTGLNRAYWRAQTQIEGNHGVVYNGDIKNFSAAFTGIQVYAQDVAGQNVVIELQVGLKQRSDGNGGWIGGYHGLRPLTLPEFKNSFKASSDDSSDPLFDPFTAINPTYVDIINVEFASKSKLAIEYSVYDVIRITLDPSFKQGDTGYFLVNDGLGFTDGKTFFGNPNNPFRGNFKLYDPSNGFQP
jgi:hypothetical protein